MKAVIPCAKKKENMFPFSETKPTALMPVMGNPIIDHLIESLENADVDEFYIIANHMEEKLEEKFENKPSVNILHQENLNGTGSALELCEDIDEEFFVVNGDVVVSERDLENLKEKFKQGESKASLLAAGEDKPEKFGVLSITNDQVSGLDEKPEEPDNTLVNTGIYIFKPEIIDILKDMDSEEKFVTDAVREFIEEEAINFELIEDYWLDIGTPKKLLKADKIKREYEIQENKISGSAEVHENAHIIGNAVIEDDVTVKPGAVLEGDVFIGEGSEIEPNTHIKNTSITQGSIIQADSIKDCLMFEDCISDSGVNIENSILAEEFNARSGSVIRESFIGARSYIDMNNSIRGVKFVPDARTDLAEISK